MISYLLRSTGLLAALIASAALLHFFVIEPSEVDGRSMQDTFHDGDFVMIDKISLLIHRPNRGDVISFFGQYPGTLSIKRVVGLPGEIVSLEKGRVIIQQPDGTQLKLSEDYLSLGTRTLPDSGFQAVYPVLAADEYFVLGDNREHSDDSRIYGPVKRNQIIGLIR